MTPGERARAFVDEILIPREVDAELGRISQDDIALIRREALARGVSGGLHSREHGGQGWTHVEWFEVEEQFGRSTNALSWHIPTAYNVLAHGSEAQIDRWLRPAPTSAFPDLSLICNHRQQQRDFSTIRTLMLR